MSEMVKNSTLISHAIDYDKKAREILERRPEWVTGDPIERAIEYADLAYYFRRLAS